MCLVLWRLSRMLVKRRSVLLRRQIGNPHWRLNCQRQRVPNWRRLQHVRRRVFYGQWRWEGRPLWGIIRRCLECSRSCSRVCARGVHWHRRVRMRRRPARELEVLLRLRTLQDVIGELSLLLPETSSMRVALSRGR
jgi:hypothetical protein